jgi:CheY-like chemotaxis protein
MHALIVESNIELVQLWKGYLERLHITVTLADTGHRALNLIQQKSFDVIVIDLVLRQGSPLVIADMAQFHQPDANVVFVTDTTFFSDGSIFSHSANARAFIESHTPPDDLAAIVHHYGANSRDHGAHQAS